MSTLRGKEGGAKNPEKPRNNSHRENKLWYNVHNSKAEVDNGAAVAGAGVPRPSIIEGNKL